MKRYHPLLVSLHWLLAALVIGAVGIAIAGVKVGYPAPSFAAAPVYFGLLILGKPNGKPMHAHPPTTRDGLLK